MSRTLTRSIQKRCIQFNYGHIEITRIVGFICHFSSANKDFSSSYLFATKIQFGRNSILFPSLCGSIVSLYSHPTLAAMGDNENNKIFIVLPKKNCLSV